MEDQAKEIRWPVDTKNRKAAYLGLSFTGQTGQAFLNKCIERDFSFSYGKEKVNPKIMALGAFRKKDLVSQQENLDSIIRLPQNFIDYPDLLLPFVKKDIEECIKENFDRCVKKLDSKSGRKTMQGVLDLQRGNYYPFYTKGTPQGEEDNIVQAVCDYFSGSEIDLLEFLNILFVPLVQSPVEDSYFVLHKGELLSIDKKTADDIGHVYGSGKGIEVLWKKIHRGLYEKKYTLDEVYIKAYEYLVKDLRQRFNIEPFLILGNCGEIVPAAVGSIEEIQKVSLYEKEKTFELEGIQAKKIIQEYVLGENGIVEIESCVSVMEKGVEKFIIRLRREYREEDEVKEVVEEETYQNVTCIIDRGLVEKVTVKKISALINPRVVTLKEDPIFEYNGCRFDLLPEVPLLRDAMNDSEVKKYYEDFLVCDSMRLNIQHELALLLETFQKRGIQLPDVEPDDDGLNLKALSLYNEDFELGNLFDRYFTRRKMLKILSKPNIPSELKINQAETCLIESEERETVRSNQLNGLEEEARCFIEEFQAACSALEEAGERPRAALEKTIERMRAEGEQIAQTLMIKVLRMLNRIYIYDEVKEAIVGFEKLALEEFLVVLKQHELLVELFLPDKDPGELIFLKTQNILRNWDFVPEFLKSADNVKKIRSKLELETKGAGYWVSLSNLPEKLSNLLLLLDEVQSLWDDENAEQIEHWISELMKIKAMCKQFSSFIKEIKQKSWDGLGVELAKNKENKRIISKLENGFNQFHLILYEFDQRLKGDEFEEQFRERVDYLLNSELDEPWLKVGGIQVDFIAQKLASIFDGLTKAMEGSSDNYTMKLVREACWEYIQEIREHESTPRFFKGLQNATRSGKEKSERRINLVSSWLSILKSPGYSPMEKFERLKREISLQMNEDEQRDDEKKAPLAFLLRGGSHHTPAHRLWDEFIEKMCDLLDEVGCNVFEKPRLEEETLTKKVDSMLSTLS